MTITVRPAGTADVEVVEAMLLEAARWVDELGVVMWEEGELEHTAIRAEVTSGQFFIAEADGVPAGAVRFQLEDLLFWPDIPQGDSAFIHRLVVRRAFKGQGISTALMQWAIEEARRRGRTWLRLDTDSTRPKLCALYERFGFRLHSFRQVQSYYVARYEYPV